MESGFASLEAFIPEVDEDLHLYPSPFVMSDDLTLNIEVDMNQNFWHDRLVNYVIIANDSSDQRLINDMKSSIRIF